MKSITVVIPAFNEEKAIQATVKAVQKLDYISEILVVDDGSTDETAALAEQAGARVLKLRPNRGKGGAMNAALQYIDTDIVAFIDADLGGCAEQVGLILKPIINEEADLAIAAFPPAQKKGGFGLVKNTARRAIKKAGQIEVISPLSGQRAMTRKVLMAVTPFREAYGVELGMTLRALQKGFKLVEVPTTMTHNETGRDLKGFMHRGRQFIDVIKVIIAESGGKKQ
ncbi:MAG TPA: glycosyltransferase family 2 protein [Syntrophomonadaceae bacterium]|nr:glycosyltransferase family 2 protein [Syntrophomonadaceae bacterium]HNX28324.1 glycosyltransferase family 2 protein [Syntrophomonadaceae bacterium]HPR92531.1 glycosyltransferase family 2 protein [Syntrophomonadaceae bacterium]